MTEDIIHAAPAVLAFHTILAALLAGKAVVRTPRVLLPLAARRGAAAVWAP